MALTKNYILRILLAEAGGRGESDPDDDGGIYIMADPVCLTKEKTLAYYALRFFSISPPRPRSKSVTGSGTTEATRKSKM
jgi:hypothetical protein